MNFLEALSEAVEVISKGEKQQEGKLDEIYLYEKNDKTLVYLKDCEGSLEFTCDDTLPSQIYLTSFLDKRLRDTGLSLEVIFSKDWEVRLRKNLHLQVDECLDGCLSGRLEAA